MGNGLPPGLYDLLHTAKLHEQLRTAGLVGQAKWKHLDDSELSQRLASELARELALFISTELSSVKAEKLLDALHALFDGPERLNPVIQELRPLTLEVLQQITKESSPAPANESIHPDIPLSLSALLTGSSRSPSLRTQLVKELASCDRADWLISFIRYSGLVPILPALERFTATPNPDGKARLRIATTSYMGATELKAIQALLDLPNTEVRISYDTRRTRLHAKAYLFHRGTGFSSAYIGSANLSKAALDEGLEWTAKISQYETAHLWKHAVATFDSHWEDTTEFTPCLQESLTSLGEALAAERRVGNQPEGVIPFFDLRPYQYQQVILDDIEEERNAGKTKHLVIAATGTGKTMVAAFDYKRYAATRKGYPRVLYIAHREEILTQARGAFRQVLRNGSFGELLAGGNNPERYEALFCTVQSWHSKALHRLEPSYFDYVVLDEAHHASASSYQALISHIQPQSLLGLTATPERNDGKDIRHDFGGRFTHEIRLPEAVERALLVPFHFYGIPDLDGIDFSGLRWSRGGYDEAQIRELIEHNQKRAHWVLSQLDRYVNAIGDIRALGFCVSVEHARFMAHYCMEMGVQAISLSADSPANLRNEAQQKLAAKEVNIIFTVDLYNEGVDIPSVDTVLFLRPTESLTIFLQQLGRGLRIHEGKSHLTVLDFIAPQHRNFSYAKRFEALSSRPDRSLKSQIESDMPFVPAGCLVHLERQAKEHVIQNINAATTALRRQRLLQELRELKQALDRPVMLEDMLSCLHMDSPDELYHKGLPHQLLALAEDQELPMPLDGYEAALAKGFRRLLLTDDTDLVADGINALTGTVAAQPESQLLLQSVLWGSNRPQSLQQALEFINARPGLKHDLKELFEWLQGHTVPHRAKRFPDMAGVLSLHASYTREQVLLALGQGSFEQPKASREGVLHISERKVDLLFADINKSEDDFSPTTMYDDYAKTDQLFHWQSQSQTSQESATGQRYINHREQGYTPLLFIRDRKTLQNRLTAPYFFAGPLRYESHEGSMPISIIWKLEHPLPAKALTWARRVG